MAGRVLDVPCRVGRAPLDRDAVVTPYVVIFVFGIALIVFALVDDWIISRREPTANVWARLAEIGHEAEAHHFDDPGARTDGSDA